MPRILYIDDDEGLRLLTQRALRRRGYEVETAGGGDEGVALLKARSFDLVAVDHYMPGKDGLQTIATIGDLPSPPPIVYVTGSEESRVAVAALKAGAADYVVKTIGEDFFDLLTSSFEQVLEHTRLVSEKAQTEAALRASKERLEALLKEANHRVANSLQIVSAFVRMQASATTSEEARSALRDTQQRITAIAQVHRRLYSTDEIETVEMADYLAALLAEVEATWSTPRSPRTVKLQAGAVRLTTDKAVSLGVIVTELVSNACKYAYPADSSGEIRVVLSPEDDGFLLRVEDDGHGYSEADAPQGTGIGSKLIRAMAQSLGTELVQEPGSGVKVSLRASF